MPEAGESYSAAGVNYERLQEEVLAGEANVKELQPMPSSSAGKIWGRDYCSLVLPGKVISLVS